jgi:outer membrane murein-binding lipoprotein Lpp
MPSQPTSAAHQTPSQQQEIAAYKTLVETLNGKIDRLNAPLERKYQAYQAARYDEQIALMNDRAAAFHWQGFASNVMLWVVVLVVISGLLFTAAQLRHAMRFGTDTPSTVEANAQGMKITSSIVGLVVLMVSIVFVLTFVNQIYSIQVVQLSPGK